MGLCLLIGTAVITVVTPKKKAKNNSRELFRSCSNSKLLFFASPALVGPGSRSCDLLFIFRLERRVIRKDLHLSNENNTKINLLLMFFVS